MIINNSKGQEIELDKLVSFKINDIEITFSTKFIEKLLFDKDEEAWNKLNPTKK